MEFLEALQDTPYGDEERHDMEQLVLKAGDLIREGAQLDDYGRLIYTALQRRRYDRYRDPLRPLPEEGPARYIDGLAEGVTADLETLNFWLDTELVTTREDPENEAALNAKAVNPMRKHHIYTVRDVLVAGRRWIDDIANIGEQGLGEISDMLASNGPYDLRWLELPGLNDIVRLSSGKLSKVTTYVLECRRDIIGVTSDSQMYLPHSVEGVLALEVEPDRERDDPMTLHWKRKQRESQEAAGIFAAVYREARERLATE